MTNEQRDELLISLAKGLNNLQESFNDFRKEIKDELNTKINALEQKIDEVIKDNQEIKKYISDNEKGVVDIIRDFNKHNYEVDQHLKKHDEEIQELKTKFA